MSISSALSDDLMKMYEERCLLRAVPGLLSTSPGGMLELSPDEDISIIEIKQCRCEYCLVINDKTIGTCNYCGAPLYMMYN